MTRSKIDAANTKQRGLRILMSTTLVLATMALFVCDARADNQWDISPYDIRVWLLTDGSAEMNAWSTRLPDLIVDELDLRFGAGWKVAARVVDHPTSMGDIENVSVERVAVIDAEAIKADKIFLVQLSSMGAQKSIDVCEFDCNTRRVGPVLQTSVLQDARLVSELTQSIVTSFSPIGLIGRSKGDAVVVRMRAGLLDVAKQTPITPANGSLMQAVLRKSDRLGNPIPDGIETVAWTVLSATAKPADDEGLIVPPGAVYCQIVSGLRNPIRSRGSRRVERFALVTKPRSDVTTLQLVDRKNTDIPLTGYDVYQRLPGDKTSVLVGRSDWRGQLTIPRDEHPLKTFYIKNGDRFLARLPIVVGLEQQVTALLTDDSLRLEAEGFLKGIQEEIVDLVARRKILSLRVEKRIEDNKLDEAETLLDELRQLATRQDIERRIRLRETNFQTRDKTLQDRINRMFRDTRSLLSKHLSSREIDDLRSQLADAKRNQPASEANVP